MASNKVRKTSPLTVSRPELLEESGDARFRELLHGIFGFSLQLHAASARFGAFIGLSPAQYMILIAVARLEPQEAGIAQIAEQLHISGPFVTIEVNKLVNLGLVVKTPHPSDGRRVILKTSTKGEQRLASLAEFQRPVNDALFASLKRQDFITLHRLISALSAGGDRALAIADFVEGQLKPRAKTG